jgi:hypothetical protein
MAKLMIGKIMFKPTTTKVIMEKLTNEYIYFMAKPTMKKLIMVKINMNEIIMAKIKMIKIFMAKLNMAKVDSEMRLIKMVKLIMNK